jgi:outer membrane protein
MLRNLFFTIFVGLFSLSAQAYSLKETWMSARLHMESVQRAQQGVTQREEQKSRAVGALLPTINGFANYTRIDPPSASGFSAFTLTKQYSVGVRLVQPLIRGGAYSGLQAAKENVLLSQFQKDAQELDLFQTVINAYYSLKMVQVDVKNLESFLNLTKDRVSEIRSRTKIGRSRRGELVEAEAQLHAAESQFQQGQRDLIEAEKNFEFLTGKKVQDLPELGPIPAVVNDQFNYLDKLKKRPDILALEQQVRVSHHMVNVSKGGHYPNLDLVGNYYVDRTGILASSEWDAGIVLSVPFYQGGTVQAQVREAVASKRISELTAHETIRSAERQVSLIYQNHLRLIEQLKSIKEARMKSEEAYKLNLKDYQFGLVTNLDVLQSMNSFIQNKRSYDSLFVAGHMSYQNLEAASGVLP